MSRRSAPRRAITIVEVIIASAILLLAASALTYAITTGVMLSAAAADNCRANALAGALLEEIIALPYADAEGDPDPGPDAGETSRALFDNMDDFDNYTEAAGTLTDAAGVAYPAQFGQFSRSVDAVYENLTITGFSAAVVGLTVTVTVQDAQGQAWTVKRFMAEP